MFEMRRFDEVRRENVVFKRSPIVYCRRHTHSYKNEQFIVNVVK